VEFMLAADKGPFAAVAAPEIAKRSPRFRGGVTAARAHPTALAKAGLLNASKTESRLVYSLSEKGERLLVTLDALQQTGPARFRTTAEARLLAVLARLEGEGFDAATIDPGAEYELISTLSDKVAQLARHQFRLRVMASGRA
jgi:hypothetical protein